MTLLAWLGGACCGASVALFIGWRVALSAYRQGCEVGYRRGLEVANEAKEADR